MTEVIKRSMPHLWMDCFPLRSTQALTLKQTALFLRMISSCSPMVMHCINKLARVKWPPLMNSLWTVMWSIVKMTALVIYATLVHLRNLILCQEGQDNSESCLDQIKPSFIGINLKIWLEQVSDTQIITLLDYFVSRRLFSELLSFVYWSQVYWFRFHFTNL